MKIQTIPISNRLRLKLDDNIKVGDIVTCNFVAQGRKSFLFFKYWVNIKSKERNPLKVLKNYIDDSN